MEKYKKFYDLFGNKPIIGMIHGAGDKPVDRAMKELDIYEEEGVNGAIIENYHCPIETVVKILERAVRDQREEHRVEPVVSRLPVSN